MNYHVADDQIVCQLWRVGSVHSPYILRRRKSTIIVRIVRTACRYLVKIVDKSKVGGGRDRRTKSVTPNTSKIELNTLESNPNFLNILSNATISYL